jgi:hypothetical protein
MTLSPEVIIAFVGIFGSVIATTTGLGWFLNGRFYKVKSEVLDVFSLHETKDESRFVSLSEQIKQIQLRNASIDGRAGHRKIPSS